MIGGCDAFNGLYPEQNAGADTSSCSGYQICETTDRLPRNIAVLVLKRLYQLASFSKPILSRSVVSAYVFWFTIVACATVGLPVRATTIVAVSRNGEIIIAADARQARVGCKGKFGHPKQVCKIRQIRGYFIALSGIAGYRTTSIFDLIASDPALIGDAPPEYLFGAAATNALTALHAIQLKKPRRHGCLVSLYYVDLILAGYKDGKPFFMRIRIGPADVFTRESTKTVTREVPKSLDLRAQFIYPEIAILGVDDGIQRLQSADPNWKDGTPEQVARRLVMAELANKESSDLVGPPMSMLSLTKDGPQWIELGACKQH